MTVDKTKDPANPASTTYAYDTMAPRWALVDALMGGTEAMRLAGATFLPKHPEETDESYSCRLNVAVLDNIFEQTLNNLCSKPFAEDVKLGDDVPTKITPYLQDIDLLGNALDVYLRDWFQLGMAKGYAHTIVDLPVITPNADGSPRTLADDNSQEIRPFWILVRPENVIHMDEKIVNGKPVLIYLRMWEYTTERQGFSEVVVATIREIEPGVSRVWKPEKVGNSDEVKWVMIDEVLTASTDCLTTVTFYAGRRETLMVTKPPLLDLAFMNVAHWQSSSEQQHSLTTARFPILACEGASENDSKPLVLGPNQVLYSPKGATFKYIEHTGAAIGVARADLDKLEEQMSNYGAEFLKSDPGDPTATAKAIDSAESNSSLASIVGKFEDAAAQALGFTAQLAGITETREDGSPNGGTIELVKSFTPDIADNQPALGALQAARVNKDLSREALISGLQLFGVLPEDFDPEADKVLLDAETQKALEDGVAMAGAMADLDPSAPAPIGTPQPSPAPKPAPKAPK